MKKIIFLLATGFAFFACSEKESNSGGKDAGSITFEITAEPSGNLSLRAGEPIYSQEPTNNVTRVSIHVFKSAADGGTFIRSYEVTGWTAGTTSKTFSVPEKLPPASYRFVALGRNPTDEYTIAPLVPDVTTVEQFTAHIQNPGDEYELYGDYTSKAISATQPNQVSLIMRRRVAGILAYCKNIPQTLGGKTIRYLRLSSDQANKKVHISSNNGGDPVFGTFNIIDIDLQQQTAPNGIYSGNNVPGVTKVENSQLMGAYRLPDANVSLTLGLYDADGVAIKTWPVKDETGATTYELRGNHFYSLGKKLKKDTTTGNDPNDPGDDDNPTDLLNDEVITITLNPEWVTIHDLTID